MSISQIAQTANVSYATAWRIINNQPCSSPEAIEAVREAMHQIGYVPSRNKKRRARVNGNGLSVRTHNIALLHLRPGSPVSTSILQSVQQMLAEHNFNLIFAHVESPQELPQAVRVGNVDGILGYGEFPSAAITPQLRQIPAVWMMSRQGVTVDQWGDRIKPDHHAIGQLAAHQLIKTGHRRLAYLNPAADTGVMQDRLVGFRAAAEEAGATVDIFACPGTDDMNTDARKLVEQWMASNPRADGLFVPVDRATLRVYRELQRWGIEPGRDLNIVSCDNEAELLSLMHPSPLSIDLNRTAIARLAVERLFWRMSNGASAPPVVITVSPSLPKSSG